MVGLRRVRWDFAIAVVLPLTILALACASSSVGGLLAPGRRLRWVGLFALAALALLQLAAAGRAPRRPPAARVVAGILLVLAAESALWSVDRRLTLERTVALALVVVAGAALAAGAPRFDVAAGRVLAGVLAGAVLVALASLLVLEFSHRDAVLPATEGAGWRFRGIGQSPNTVPMLLCVALPVAAWWALARRGMSRMLGIACVLLFVGELAVSGSRGAVLAAAGGSLVTALACVRGGRRQAVAVVVVAAAAAACVGIAKIPQPLAAAPAAASAGPQPSAPKQRPRGIDAQAVFRLEDEIGFPLQGAYRPPARRTIFGSSGRAQAWEGALEQGKQRPVAGYGFGTEEHVFVDRFYGFEGIFVENGYLGLFLELGVAGLALLGIALLALLWDGSRALRLGGRAGPAAAASGVLVAAVLIELSQTGLFSVGNIAAAAIWFSVLSLPLLAQEAEEQAQRFRPA